MSYGFGNSKASMLKVKEAEHDEGLKAIPKALEHLCAVLGRAPESHMELGVLCRRGVAGP